MMGNTKEKTITLKLDWPNYMMFYRFSNNIKDNKKISFDFIANKISDYTIYTDRMKHYDENDCFDWYKEPAYSIIKKAKEHIGIDSEYIKSLKGIPQIVKEFIYIQGGDDFKVPIKNGMLAWKALDPIIYNAINDFYPRASSIMKKFNLLAKNKFYYKDKDSNNNDIAYIHTLPKIHLNELDTIFNYNWQIVRAYEYLDYGSDDITEIITNDKYILNKYKNIARKFNQKETEHLLFNNVLIKIINNVPYVYYPVKLIFLSPNNEEIELNVCIKCLL